MSRPIALDRLAAGLDGTLLLPGTPGHDAARRPAIRGLVEKVPRAVLRCASRRDVVRAVAFARDHGMPFALRGGGHSFADRSSTDGLLVDLGGMDTVEVSGDTVTVGPGTRIGDLAGQLAATGRLVPAGWCPTVGIVGAALGGGFGPFSRRYGLTCDHVVAADVVLADGRTVRADADRHPDLFWALRGAGGGQFGAVTSLVLRTRSAPAATMFALTWTFEHAATLVENWQRWAPVADDTVNAELVVAAGGLPGLAPLTVLFGVVLGGPERAEAVLRPFEDRIGAAPLRRTVTALTGREATVHDWYAGMPYAGPPPLAPGQRPGRRVVRSEFFDTPLPRTAIERLLDRLAADRVAGQYRELEFVPWRGAYRRVPADATAFPHREALFLLEHNADVGPDADDPARRAVHDWVTGSWSTVRPWGSGGVYPNYPDPDLAGWATAYHGGNLGRLAEVKARYDPTDLFRSAQSVPPAGGPPPVETPREATWPR
ncbi:FAD-binding oxidoreductase [Polymorphospora sp. NPDC050346]|uniref:FAD-binding oxidoreductase n=1 Tax=Polymorphospora sp. NPDC050346 TaxID=3155780 RepID=UPI0033FAD0CA